MPRLLHRPLSVALLIGGFAQLLFCWRLGVPSKLMFDEVHYVPAARTLLSLARPVNIEHPLLGKELIAAGMLLFGDGPIGWRFLSTVAGTATLLGIYAVAWRVFGTVRTATLAALLALLNFTLFIQARIAMLDGFMAAFVVLAVAAILWGMRSPRAIAWWTAGAALLGLAMGVKWTAVPYVAYAALAFALLKRSDPGRWPSLKLLPGWAILAAVSASVYLLTFAPAFFYAERPLTPATLLPFQLEMFRQQTQVLPAHTYQSSWWTWPFLLRPIWYLYEPVDGVQRGVLMVGNPAVMWGGLVAVALCLREWARDRDVRSGGVAGLWIGSYAVWAIIPKSLGFFYYYYLPSLWLPLAIAAAFQHFGRGKLRDWDETFLIFAAGLFVYFYPILSAARLSGPEAFHRWTWFPSWV